MIRFWLANEQMFPNLTRIALRIYATPVSSATNERNFSFGSKIEAPERSSLAPDVVCDLLFCRFQMNAGPLCHGEEN